MTTSTLPPEESRASTAASREPDRSTGVPLKLLFRVASIAGGVQFGGALQLSLLTPYVQELGIPHAWAGLIWLCSPVCGLFVQPLVGLISDRCRSRFGRRRPFLLGGAISILISVLVIGFSADIGRLFADRGDVKVRAIAAFVLGFWLLDAANNATQAPCRALLADLTKKDHRRTRIANAYFSLFMAAGNILGCATGSFSGWYKIFPFTLTDACAINCANLKSAFLLDIVFVAITTCVSLSAVKEQPLDSHCNEDGEQEEPFLWELFGTLKHFPATVWVVLLVTTLTWIAWFSFTLYDTDWVGREIYGGEPNGPNYSNGVRMGSLGLMLNSVAMGLTSVFVEKLCAKRGPGFAWGVSNVVLSLCFIAMLVITAIRNHMDIAPDDPPPNAIVIAVLLVFAILGVPLSITYSVPYALVASQIENSGLGQGLSMGVLNLAIVIPQILVSVGSGGWDELFGGGNSPAFLVAAISAFAAGLVAMFAIPRTRVRKQNHLRP